jgi:hypothetical protein
LTVHLAFLTGFKNRVRRPGPLGHQLCWTRALRKGAHRPVATRKGERRTPASGWRIWAR